MMFRLTDKMVNVKKGCLDRRGGQEMLEYESKHHISNWTSVSKKAGLKRYGKSCSHRWTNHLKPEPKHESFTPQEEELIINLHAAIGSRWSIIAQQLPGKLDAEVKNCWNTKLRKKLTQMGIDPVTHKPFSQLLADYGNMGGLPKTRTQIVSFNRDLKNTFVLNSEQSQIQFQPEVFSNFNSHFTSSIAPTKTEPTQDYQSLDLLAQLQSIMLVTEPSNCINHETTGHQFFSEGSSSSPASPSCSTDNQMRLSPSFSWHDFLLEDAFLEEKTEEQETLVGIPPNGYSSHIQYDMPQCDLNTEEMQHLEGAQELEFSTQNNGLQSPSSSKSSFVEAILEKDTSNDTLFGFPGLLEEPFYY